LSNIISVGLMEQKEYRVGKVANPRDLNKVTHVEYKYLNSVDRSIECVKQQGGDKFTILHVQYVSEGEGTLNLVHPEFRSKLGSIGLERIIEDCHPRWISFHLGFATEELESGGQFDHDVAKSEILERNEVKKRIIENLKYIKENYHDVDVLLENLDYNPPERSKGAYEFVTDPGFINDVLNDTNTYLLLDLAHAEISAKNLGYINAKDYIGKLPLDRVLEIHLAKPGERAGLPLDSHEEITDTKLFEFVLNKTTNLKAVTLETFSSLGRQLDLIKKALRRNKRRILEDVVKPKYYFAINNFAHRKVFDEVNYVWEAIEKIGPYAKDYVSIKIQDLNSKLARPLNRISKRAEMHKTSVIGKNVNIEEGVEIGAYTVIADNVFIGKNTKIGEYVVVKNGVFIGEDCHLEEKVVLKNKVLIGNRVSVNPAGVIIDEVIIDEGATIGAFSRIKNKVYIGKKTVTGHPWIEGPTVIGAHCDLRPGTYIRGNVILGDYVEFRSEAKNSIILGSVISDKRIIPGASAHFGYLGDSIIGFGVNLGAGTKISNVKTDWTQVTVDVDGWRFRTGFYKLGTIIGDLSSTGCNSVINPGTLIGKAAGVYALSTLRGFVPSGHLVKMRPKQEMVKMKKITSDSLLSRADLVNRLLGHQK